MSTQDWTEPQAARILGVSARTLRRWRAKGEVEFMRTPGGRIRYSDDSLLDFRRKMRVKTGTPV